MLSTIRTLFGFLKPYPAVLPTVAVLGLFGSFAEGLGIVFLIPFLDMLTAGGPSTDPTGPVAGALSRYADLFDASSRVAIVGVTIAGLILLSCLINFIYLLVLSKASTRVAHDLRTELFERFVNSDEAFVEKGAHGRQIKAIDGATHRAGQATISLCLLLVNAITVLVILALLAAVSWRMSIVVLLGIGCAGLVVRTVVARSMSISHRYERRASALSDVTVQVLGSLRMVRIFGQEQRELAHFKQLSETLHRDEAKLESVRRSMAPLVDGIAAPLLVGGLVVATQAGVGIAVLLPFLLLVFRLQRHVREFDVNRVWIAADAGAIDEVAALVGQPRRHEQHDERPSAGALQDRIVFDDVSFVHPGEQGGLPGSAPRRLPSLQGVSLQIHRGETLGIIGTSGAGKSTLIDLLCGLREPTTGQILIDGAPLAGFRPSSWRRRIGFAGQDADLLAGSVFDNIAYAHPDAAPDEVHEVARLAGAADFIQALPQGYGTPVGVRGMQLSGGERQRIAIARALLGKPDILVLDEATNALDNATEALVRETLERLSGSLTMIVIAHRLASIRHADRVLVLSGGRIVEQGRPAALIERGGAFFELNRLEAVR